MIKEKLHFSDLKKGNKIQNKYKTQFMDNQFLENYI